MDLFSDEMRRNPYPVYDQMRAVAPVFHLAQFDLWMIFDYDGVKRALIDHDAFSSDLSHVPGQGNPGEWFLFFDPPRHTKLRTLIAKAFTPRVVADLEPRLRDLSRELLDQSMRGGEMDLATDFSVPFPMRVIAELLGVPASDWPRYKRWSDAILEIANTFTRDEAAAPAGPKGKLALWPVPSRQQRSPTAVSPFFQPLTSLQFDERCGSTSQ